MDESRKRNLFERVEFALFLKVLIKLLNNDQQYMIVRNAKIIIIQCTRGNKAGDSNCIPLIGSIVMRLRPLVGKWYWDRAMEYTKWYVRRQNNRYQVRKFYETEHEALLRVTAAEKASSKQDKQPGAATSTSPSPRPIIGI